MNANFATRAALAASFVVLLTTSAPVLANNSGGSMSSAPSTSTPSFDVADEYRRGIEALKASQFDQASKSFSHVLTVSSSDANVNFLAGMARAGLNDLKGAAKYYEHAVRADSKLVPAHQELAVTYLK